ncbi:polysaccharide lyase family 7 protein [Vibrio hippocampi]|uniref:Alginate lyase n=1 Tax=Vibrio hippocampi TaxID=654686 RepID=A0ABM8ZLT3_9VIBR|nr:polysaccharide lyase family 7 protein [Vibrio hippocampi]CAH0529467.1 Alginate lyase [Vibrio hippocampi]
MKKQLLAVSTLLAISSFASAKVQFSDENGTLGAPVNYSQYQSVLKASELQISDAEGKKGNKEYFALDGDFTGIVNPYFFVDKSSEALVFKMKNDHLRNELRVHKNFRTDLPNKFYKLSSEVQLVDPEASMKNSTGAANEITFLQVHNKGLDNEGTHNVPHPLLRVVWKQDANGVKGHYWAIVKNNAIICKGKFGEKNKDKPFCHKDNAYTQYDLGKAPLDKTTAFDITVGNKMMQIDVNGKTMVNHDIDYWRHLLSYFKAGVYNQFKDGMSEAHFYKLDYTATESK